MAASAARTRRLERLERFYELSCAALEALAAAGVEAPAKLKADHTAAIEKIARYRAAAAVRHCARRARRQSRPRARPARGTAAPRSAQPAPRRRRAAGARKKVVAEPEPDGGESELVWRLGPLMNVDAIAERVLKRSKLWPLLGSQTRWELRRLFRARPFTPAHAEAVDRIITCSTGCRPPGRAWWPAISGPIPTLALLVRVEGLLRIVAVDLDEAGAATWCTRGNA